MTDYEWLTSMGLCHRCRRQKTAQGKKFCFDCLAKIRRENAIRYNPEAAKKYQERRRELYWKKKEAGICVRCSKPATYGLYCHEHSIKEKRRNRMNSERRKWIRREKGLVPDQKKAQGICLWCENKAEPGLCCCSYHRNLFSDAGKKGFEANLRNKNNPWINEVEA